MLGLESSSPFFPKHLQLLNPQIDTPSSEGLTSRSSPWAVETICTTSAGCEKPQWKGRYHLSQSVPLSSNLGKRHVGKGNGKQVEAMQSKSMLFRPANKCLRSLIVFFLLHLQDNAGWCWISSPFERQRKPFGTVREVAYEAGRFAMRGWLLVSLIQPQLACQWLLFPESSMDCQSAPCFARDIIPAINICDSGKKKLKHKINVHKSVHCQCSKAAFKRLVAPTSHENEEVPFMTGLHKSKMRLAKEVKMERGILGQQLPHCSWSVLWRLLAGTYYNENVKSKNRA